MDIQRIGPHQFTETPVGRAPRMDLGTAVIPKERYTSAEFMKLEWERVWKKCWLLGGLAADIPNPGDYLVTNIARESILIVRPLD